METVSQPEYVGFWKRTLATLVDTALTMAITVPLMIIVTGRSSIGDAVDTPRYNAADFLINFVLPTIAVLLFWMKEQRTPGKMLFNAVIVDAATGGVPTLGQYVGRYFAYFVSFLFLGLGFIWVAFDPKKQGWHDKLAGTCVIVRAAVRSAT